MWSQTTTVERDNHTQQTEAAPSSIIAEQSSLAEMIMGIKDHSHTHTLICFVISYIVKSDQLND